MVADMPRRSRIASAALFAAALAAPVVVRLAAQPTQPIYLQYDGYVRIKGGGYVLSYGYFNMNNTDVPIAPGSSNTFVPAPGDRNQPVVFVKGRHRFACTIVVDQNFDGKLQWSVAFGGRTSTTTAKTFDPLYELELNSEKHVLQGLDMASAPKNVCVNRAPMTAVATSPFEAPATENVELQAKAGQELPIAGRVEDDGLPRGSKVTSAWKKVSGPGEVTFADPAAATTRATFSAAGNYELELSATDGEKRSTLTVKNHQVVTRNSRLATRTCDVRLDCRLVTFDLRLAT